MASLKYIQDSNIMTVTLGSNYTSGAGSMSLTSGHGARLPTGGDFWLGHDTGAGLRFFKVTSRSTDTLTVTAVASEGLGDGNISSGQTLKWALTYDALTQLRADIISDAAVGMKFLLKQTASSSTNLDFTSVITSAYSDYKLFLSGIVLVTNNANLQLRFSTDNGATWLTASNYNWGGIRSNSGGNAALGANSVSGLVLTHSQENTAAGPAACFDYTIFDPLNSSKKPVVAGTGFDYSSGLNSVQISGYYNVAGAVNAIRLFSSDGNGILSGYASLFGLKTS